MRLGIKKAIKPLAFITIALLVICLLIMLRLGCYEMYIKPFTFTVVESKRAYLINGIESYQSVEEFKTFLVNNSLIWGEDHYSEPGLNGSHDCIMFSITIKNYSYLGFHGELDVDFFNDRLMSTTFRTNDSDNFIETFKKAMNIKFNEYNEAELPPYVSFRIMGDDNKKDITWYDTRLSKEKMIWLLRNS